MKKKLIPLFLLMIFLTGCSKSTEVLLTFPENKSSYSIEGSKENDSPILADTFAQNLCVISKDLKQTKDTHLSALATLVVNASSNQVIYSDNIYERLYPASITKIVTAYVVLKHANLSDTVTFSYNASHITESGAKLCGFKEGDTIKLEDLLVSLLVYSGNDAGIAIAEHVGGSEEGFAKMMNDEMKSIAAVHSNFVNAHGLHDVNHYTTAYDLYLVFNELVKDERFISMINTVNFTAQYKTKNKENASKVFINTNRYLKGTEDAPEGITVLGGKTGTTFKAGSCLILYSKDSKDNNYISLVLKAPNGNSLFEQMTYLLRLIP